MDIREIITHRTCACIATARRTVSFAFGDARAGAHLIVCDDGCGLEGGGEGGGGSCGVVMVEAVVVEVNLMVVNTAI